MTRTASRQSTAARGDLDRFEEQAEADGVEKAAGLVQVVAAAVHGQGERLEPRRVHAEAQHGVIDDEEDGAAVDAAGEADADRAVRRPQPQPLGDFVAQTAPM